MGIVARLHQIEHNSATCFFILWLSRSPSASQPQIPLCKWIFRLQTAVALWFFTGAWSGRERSKDVVYLFSCLFYYICFCWFFLHCNLVNFTNVFYLFIYLFLPSKWALPSRRPNGTSVYKDKALRTPFTKVFYWDHFFLRNNGSPCSWPFRERTLFPWLTELRSCSSL